MTLLWRCCKRSYLADAFSGAGGRHYGGRWHTAGRPVVYTSEEASLTLIEVLVHGLRFETALEIYALVSCELPERHIYTVEKDDLPDDWDAPQPTGKSQAWGDAWLKGGESAAIRVPSAVMPGNNVLINPLHPDAVELAPATEHIEWDPRLRTAKH